MADQTKIEWTDTTWNPVTGCDRVSPGCDHCYIERTVPFRRDGRRFDEHGRMGILLHRDRLEQPLHWRKPRRVFVCSLADLFHPRVHPLYIADVWATMAVADVHTFQVLTKRPQRMARLLASKIFDTTVAQAVARIAGPDYQYEWPLRNVWMGVSVESQQYARLRVPHLLTTPAALRWLSVEPMLGPVSIREWLPGYVDREKLRRKPSRSPTVGWVVIGGETGPGARPMHPWWPRDLLNQCLYAEVPVFWKQGGIWAPGFEKPGANEYVTYGPTGPGMGDRIPYAMHRYGRKADAEARWADDLKVRQYPDDDKPLDA